MDDELFLDTSGVMLEEGDAPAAATAPTVEHEPVSPPPPSRRSVPMPAPANAKPVRTRTREPLFFDLETIPDYSRLESFDLPPVPPIPAETAVEKLPNPAQIVVGTVKDVETSLGKLVCPAGVWLDAVAAAEKSGKDRAGVYDAVKLARGARQLAVDAHADRCKLLSTTPEYCSIAAMGWAVGSDCVNSWVVGQIDPARGSNAPITERDILLLFWELAYQHSPLVAFNGLYFDLPVILVRSALLGVAPTKLIDTKPWGKDVIDPYILRFGPKGNSDKSRPGKLKALAPLYRIEVPAEGVDGGDVDRLMKESPAKVGEYVRSDVQVLRQFYQALQGYFWV